MIPLSICIVAQNEERNLARALESVQSVADEIVVVDGGSTRSHARSPRDSAAKSSSALSPITPTRKITPHPSPRNDWIFLLDADEELSPELEAIHPPVETERFPSLPSTRWRASRGISALGFIIRAGIRTGSAAFTPPEGSVFRRDSFRSSLRRAQSADCDGDLLHYTIRNFAEHEAKLDRYTTAIAQEMFDNGRRNWRGAMWLATPWSWAHHFFLGAGFLDGYRGALIAQMAARGCTPEVRETRQTGASGAAGQEKRYRSEMIPLIVDLEMEWRGGQNQALLLLKGLYERGHAAELVAAKGVFPGPSRPQGRHLRHTMSPRTRCELRAAVQESAAILRDGRIELVHANEAHAVTAAWLAGLPAECRS